MLLISSKKEVSLSKELNPVLYFFLFEISSTSISSITFLLKILLFLLFSSSTFFSSLFFFR